MIAVTPLVSVKAKSSIRNITRITELSTTHCYPTAPSYRTGGHLSWPRTLSFAVNEYTNFHNFGRAIMALLRAATGEEWNRMMYACASQKGTLIALAYFGSFITITMFVMLNLFIMVIVQTYEDFTNDPKSAIQKFYKFVKRFKMVWASYTSSNEEVKIYYEKLPQFFIDLVACEPKLKVDENATTSMIIKILSTMDMATLSLSAEPMGLWSECTGIRRCAWLAMPPLGRECNWLTQAMASMRSVTRNSTASVLLVAANMASALMYPT